MSRYKKASATILIILGIIISLCTWSYMRSQDYRKVGVPVLNYHQVNSSFASALTMHPLEFERQLKYLADEGYTSITLDQLYEYTVHHKELPPKPVLITFDDGYIDNYEVALPLLEKYHMKATLFMISDAIGAPRFVTANQLLDMEQRGFHIESHTDTHRRLDTLSAEETFKEFTVSKEKLEKILHHPITYMAYPQGFAPQEVERIGPKSQYKMGFTVAPGNIKEGMDVFRLPRQAIFANDYPFISFWMRLHYPEEVASLWNFRDWLLVKGFVGIASIVPLF